jgi:hypothetical protein
MTTKTPICNLTQAQLQEAATNFIQHHGRNQEADWRWERTAMLNQFIARLFKSHVLTNPELEIEDWQQAHARRWDRLNLLGWRGVEPQFARKPGEVGIRMVQDGTGMWAEFITDNNTASIEAIHTTLLEAAERFIAKQSTPPLA